MKKTLKYRSHCQGMHTVHFIRKRNELHLPLPSQPQYLAVSPTRTACFSRRLPVCLQNVTNNRHNGTIHWRRRSFSSKRKFFLRRCFIQVNYLHQEGSVSPGYWLSVSLCVSRISKSGWRTLVKLLEGCSVYLKGAAIFGGDLAHVTLGLGPPWRKSALSDADI